MNGLKGLRVRNWIDAAYDELIDQDFEDFYTLSLSAVLELS